MSVEVKETSAGDFLIAFRSPFLFGDTVSYQAGVNGSGFGEIVDISVQADGQLYFSILLKDRTIQPGIEAHQMQLIQRR